MNNLNEMFYGIYNDNIIVEKISENTNGIGKLFISNNDNEYVYNGSIVNGKMNGYGIIIFNKYFLYDNIKKYEGDLKDNLFDGYSKITYKDNNIFIGNFKNGKKEGNGILYDNNGNIILNNIWTNDIILGKINYIEYYNNKNIKVSGILDNNIKVSKWTYYSSKKIIEKIEYYSDDMNNEILEYYITTNINGYIEAQIIDNNNLYDLISGNFDYIKYILKNNDNSNVIYKYAIPYNKIQIKDETLVLYLNEYGKIKNINKYKDGYEEDYIVFINNKSNNILTYICVIKENETDIYKYISSNSKLYKYYQGEIKNYEPHGQGRMYDNNEKILYSGVFEKGNIVYGTIYSNTLYSTMIYKGSIKNNLAHGDGIFYDFNEIKIYEGQVSKGMRHGIGTSYWVNGSKNWQGGWNFNKKHGKGRLYDDNDILICLCEHDNDVMINIE
jgi:hypothetical protein